VLVPAGFPPEDECKQSEQGHREDQLKDYCSGCAGSRRQHDERQEGDHRGHAHHERRPSTPDPLFDQQDDAGDQIAEATASCKK
jgi:hypothetical protein